MIRFRFHTAAPAGGSRPSAAELYGSLGIEVDGVDISRGRLEDRLVPTIATLAEAATRLLEGAARTAAVPFDEGAVELLLARRGDAVTLSLVSLPRPARVLVRDVEVDLASLAGGAVACGTELLSRLCESEAAGAEARRLRQACARLARAAALPAAPLPSAGRPLSLRSGPPGGGSEAPSLGFDLRDADGRLGSYEGGDGLHTLLAPGHVYLHGPDGEELGSVAGAPFLLLRDLADVGLRLLEAGREGTFRFPLGWEGPVVEVDLKGGALTVEGRTLRCPPEALARALFTAALDLGGALLARNPRLAQNPYLASLMEEARERLALCDQLAAPARSSGPRETRAPAPRSARAEPPLARGALRRVSLRRVWTVRVGAIAQLHPAPGGLWAVGRREATRIDLARGTVDARLEGSIARAGRREPLLVASGSGLLACHEADGALRWRIPENIDRLAPAYVAVGGAAALVADGSTLLLADLASGALRLRLAPPAASRIELASAGEMALVGADNGLLYGVDGRQGEVVWRVPVGHPVERVAVLGGTAAVLAGDALHFFDAASGERCGRVELPSGARAILPLPTGWALACSGRPGGEVLGLGADGSVRWTARPNLGLRAPSLLRAGGSLYARGEEGLGRIERGRVRWNVPCAPGAAPVLARGVVALPGEELRLLDAETGRGLLLTGAISSLPPADHLLALPPDWLVVADRDGEVAGMRLAGALAVVG